MASSRAPAQPSGCLESLPDEVILEITEGLTTYQDVIRLTSAYARAYRLYREHKYSVLSHINDKVVFGTNMDIAFITFAFLRVPVIDLPQAIASMTAIVDRPHFVVKYYLHNYVLQREFLLLAGQVNRLCETYARVRNPERFWRQLAYKFASFCPKTDAKVPVGSSEADKAGRNEIASQFWDICENDDHSDTPLPPIKHSWETLEAIQRSFWAHELCCRSSIVEDLNDELYGDSGAALWMFDELPTSGVIRFLHLMVDILAHKAVIHNVGRDTFSSPQTIPSYDRSGLWSGICFLGVRAWVDVLAKPRASLGWPTVDVLQRQATQVLQSYATNSWDVVHWYYTSEMKAWRVKRSAVRGLLDGQPLGMMQAIFE